MAYFGGSVLIFVHRSVMNVFKVSGMFQMVSAMCQMVSGMCQMVSIGCKIEPTRYQMVA